MAGRRSEINALANHRYLEKKWSTTFFFTSAWNYIKFATMRDTDSYDIAASTPAFISLDDTPCFHRTLFLSWFEFIGMNHYDGERLWSAVDCAAPVSGSRSVKIERRVRADETIEVIAFWRERTKGGGELLPERHVEQAVGYIKPRMDFKMFSVVVAARVYAEGELVPDVCGLVVRDAVTSARTCYTFLPPFEYDRANSLIIRLIEGVLSALKGAKRSSVYEASARVPCVQPAHKHTQVLRDA
jgi:hypothetical protein